MEYREHLNTPNIVKEIKEYQNNWIKHLQRMSNNRIPFQAFNCRPAGRKDGGRSSRSLKDQLILRARNRLGSLNLKCSDRTRYTKTNQDV
jgi:hypothetical protein